MVQSAALPDRLRSGLRPRHAGSVGRERLELFYPDRAAVDRQRGPVVLRTAWPDQRVAGKRSNAAITWGVNMKLQMRQAAIDAINAVIEWFKELPGR